MPTILITGCSSGFGLDAARLFLDRGWRVAATMRRPDPALFPAFPDLLVLPLDVTDPAGIAAAVDAATAWAGPLDALVNNAGVGLLNALEGTDDVALRELFAVNVLGTVAATRAVLPGFRARRAGVIVNVSSSVTLRPLRLLSAYTATKAAVNAFSDSLALELEPFGIRVRSVLPGAAPDTSFAANARARFGADVPAPYADQAEAVFAAFASRDQVTRPADVSEAIWRAVTDPACPPRIPAGADAEAWFQAA